MNETVKEKGAGLLELMLVILIASIIILIPLLQYRESQKTNQIYLLQASVIDLMNGLNNYYFMNCNKGLVTNQDIKSDLIKLGLLNNVKINNPWGGENNIFAEIMEGNNHSYLLKVTVNILIPNDEPQENAIAGMLRGALNGNALQGNDHKNTVTWSRLPLHSQDNFSSLEWIIGHEKPVTLTAVSNGLTSSLWVLNRNLQAFTKQNENQTNVQPNCVN